MLKQTPVEAGQKKNSARPEIIALGEAELD